MKNIMKASDSIVTVVTVTKNRPQLLQRAINSVKKQTLSNVLHYIVIDDCKSTLEMLNNNYLEDSNIMWDFYSIGDMIPPGPCRLSALRNKAITSIKTTYVSFLDDDNEFYPEHLEQLLEFARNEKCDAVHSYREILYNDGKPYLENLSPWGHSIQQRAEKYKELLEHKIATPGSNVWCDKYGVTIDTNLWLIRTSLLQCIKFPIDYTEDDYANITPEDAKIMQAMKSQNVVVKTNQKVSVKYYLGGYSNECGKTVGTVKWGY